MDALQYKQIMIEKLNLSVRSHNALRRAGIVTLQDLLTAYEQGTLLEIRNLGIKSFEEIKNTIEEVTAEDYLFEDEVAEEDTNEDLEAYVVPEEIENISINELKLSVRLFNGLIRGGFDTVGKVVRMTQVEMLSIPRMGSKTIEELQCVIQDIKNEGIDYFSEDRARDLPIDEKHKRTIDIETVKKLKDDYGLKPAWLNEWYSVTRSRIQQILNKRRNHGNWLNRNLSEDNKSLLLTMIQQRVEIIESESGTKAYFLNNRRDDCAVVFVTDQEIKCFFMSMLPEAIQERIKESRLDCLSFEELEIISTGKTISILKEKYFCPESTGKFRQFAALREMSPDEYSLFLTGMKYATAQSTINDEKIIEFLEAHYTNGRVMIPSNNSTQWFRSFISRKGYSIEEIAELYGFGEEQVLEDETQRFGRIEEDMQCYEIETDDRIDKLFAENPLVGNRLLPDKTKEKLYSVTKGYIDKRLRDPQIKFPMAEKKQIALAVITYAKEWDTWDESGFWRYITAQFGYRDESNQLRGILCDCILDAIVKSRRWFISSVSGYQYKSTIVTHALTTKRSWMHLYDFLFDFYKTNMEWTYIKDDPIIARMVVALRGKLIAGDEANDDNLEISTKVYSFQEGIRKLIIYRTGYAIKLISHMLQRVDSIINHTESPATLYVDVLCDQWIEGKLKSARETKSRGTSEATSRNIAIDYSRIRPLYVLQNENSVVISFPDIRLKSTEFERVELKVFVEDMLIETKSLSYYGNELGKTLNSFNIDLNMCLRRGNGSLNVRVVLNCDDEMLYDSEDNFFRECLCFSDSKECDIRDCETSSYSFFTTKNDVFDFTGAEISTIDAGTYWNAYFVRLGQGFLIKLNDQVKAFDRTDESSSMDGIRVICQSSNTEAVYLKNGHRYIVVTTEPNILLIAQKREDLRKIVISINSKTVEVSSFTPEETTNGLVYTIPLQALSDKTCEYQVFDLEKNRVLSRDAFMVVPGFTVRFNRDFYFIDKDFEDAVVRVISSRGLKQFELNSSDEVLSFPLEEGTVEIKVPRVIAHDTSGQKWKHGYTAWIKEISQGEKIYLTSPGGCSLDLKVGDTDVVEEAKGRYAFGNAIFAYSSEHTTDWIDVSLSISGPQTKQKYRIGKISAKERFKSTVQFDYHDNTLYWNRGMGFVGNKAGNFRLRVEIQEGSREYPLNLDEDIAISNPDLPVREYYYQIIKESENIFLGGDTVLQSGSLYIGDQNELRFQNSMIELTNITYEEDDELRSVDIRNTYIDQIVYQGIQYVGSEDRECPVYTGVMFFMGKSMKHHNFSFADQYSEEGFQLYKINPVRIIFINEHTLSITNEDDDGIYYYRFYDRYSLDNRYAITDREPTTRNKNTYYLADLYTYRKERIM